MKAFASWSGRKLCTLLLLCLFGASLNASALRIVSLAPSLTQNLQYLGAEKDLVGCTNYCITTTKKQIVATAVKVNVELVLSLKPDLVIATNMTNKGTVATLRKFGIKVVAYPMARSFEDVCSQFMDLGKRTGREAKAVEVLRKTRQKISQLKAIPHKPLKMFMQIGADPLFCVVPHTFMNDYITFAGGENIAYDLRIGSITRETVLKRNPDVIFIVTMGIMGNSQKKEWEAVKSLNATKNKKIFIVNSDKACTPSPVSFAETLEDMVKSIR